jgi:hypothetical protein
MDVGGDFVVVLLRDDDDAEAVHVLALNRTATAAR